MANLEEVDKVVGEELTGLATNFVRRAARVANDRILAGSSKRKINSAAVANDFTEVDNVRVDGMNESVATIIKKEAVQLHGKYNELEINDKNLVRLGLNSILDLSESRNSSQQRLFGKGNWETLRTNYPLVFVNPESIITDNCMEKIIKIERLAINDVRDARATAYKYETKSNRAIAADLFAMYAHYLELIEYHSYVFNKDLDITETDLAMKMWGGILEKLFRQTNLRCKWGESVGDSSSVTDSRGFKVDLRVIKDTLSRRNKEADKANMEMARMNAPFIKTSSDRTKLLIESKCVLDRLVNEKPKSADSIVIPALQIIGNRIILHSFRIVAPGLYVAVKEATATIPSNTSRIQIFRDVIHLLLKFKKASLHLAEVSLFGDEDDDNDDSSNNNSKRISWLRGTWIPPTDNKKKSSVPDVPNVLVFADL